MWYNREDFKSNSFMQTLTTGTPHILPGLIGELQEDIEKKRYTSEIYDRPNGQDLSRLVEGYMRTIFCASDSSNEKRIRDEIISLIELLDKANQASPTYATAFSTVDQTISPTLCYLAMELLPNQEAIKVCTTIFNITGKNPTVLQLLHKKQSFMQERDRVSTLRMYSAANTMKEHHQ